MDSKAAIVGWAHSPFGKLEDADTEALMGRVAGAAIEHAGLSPQDVDSIHVGVFNAGFQKQDFQGAMPALSVPELAHVPAVRLENACATGSAAIHSALNYIESGQGRIALVIGAEKMTAKPTAEVGDILLNASYRKEEADIEGGFAGVFGRIAQTYFQRYGDRSEELARIAAKNHKNGVSNPYAQMRKDFGFEFCNTISEKNPYVAGPLRRTDCSLVSDGAAALVIASADVAETLGRAVAFRSRAHVNDIMPMSRRDPIAFEGARRAWVKALEKAGWQVSDLDLVEANEAFAAQAIAVNKDLGWDTDKVNVNGGAIAIGHPIGASGARVLTTLIYEMIRRDAKKGLATLCIGGGMGIAMCVQRD